MNSNGVLQSVLAVLPVLGLLLVSQVLNVRRERRYQQYALPAVTVLFVGIIVVVLYVFNTWFTDGLRAVVGAIPFLEGALQSQWITTVQNTAILVLFLVVKTAYRLVSRKLFVNESFVGSKSVVSKFYDYDSVNGLWFLRPHLGQLRVLMGVLFWLSVAVTSVLLYLMHLVPEWPGFASIPLPVAATLIIGEAYAALNGKLFAEQRDELTGEDDAARRMVNYASLRDIYRRLFPERVLEQGVDLTNPFTNNSFAAIEELGQSADAEERLVAEFFQNAKKAGLVVDENLVHTSLGLLRGRNALVNSPFYSDLTPYLTLPAYSRLLNGGKCLIVVGRDSGAEDIQRWFEQGLESISGVPHLWNAQLLTVREPERVDVGVLRVSDLHNLELLQANDEFFRQVEMVILAEPSRLIATGQLGLGVVVSRLGQGKAPVYCGFDRNHDGLVDALSHLLKSSITEVVATQQSTGTSSEMVWSTEGDSITHRVLPGVSRYLGVGTELAAVALKYHVNQVEWVGGDRFPVTDMAWISGQYYRPITAFAEMDHSQRALATALVMSPNPLGVQRAERRFLIVEDEISNVYESLRLFTTRATENGFVNLLAENYLMRDYMVSNRAVFVADPKAIPAIVPDYVRSVRNTVLRIFVMLTNYQMPESALLRELELVAITIDEDDLEQHQLSEPALVVLLKRLFTRFLGPFEAIFDRSTVSLPGTGVHAGERRLEPAYRLQLTPSLERVLRQLRSAYFLVEDEAEGRDYIGGCLNGHVAQTILPGQHITLGGKYYEVVSLGGAEQREEAVLRRAAEHITSRPVYRNLRSFALTDSRLRRSTAARVEGEEVTVERRTAHLVARTHGYLVVPSREDLSAPRRVMVSGIPDREYVEKDVLRLVMPGADAQIRAEISVLLNELFVTVFPAGHGFLAAVTTRPARDTDEYDVHDDLLPGFECDDDEAIYIVEDSQVDLGLLVAVERNWRRLFEVITDYLDWVHTPEAAKDLAESDEVRFVSFPDEEPHEAAQRARKIAEAEARGSYVAPTPPTLWQRIRTRVRTWRKKRADARAEARARKAAEAESDLATVEADAPAAVAGAAAAAVAVATTIHTDAVSEEQETTPTDHTQSPTESVGSVESFETVEAVESDDREETAVQVEPVEQVVTVSMEEVVEQVEPTETATPNGIAVEEGEPQSDPHPNSEVVSGEPSDTEEQTVTEPAHTTEADGTEPAPVAPAEEPTDEKK